MKKLIIILVLITSFTVHARTNPYEWGTRYTLMIIVENVYHIEAQRVTGVINDSVLTLKECRAYQKELEIRSVCIPHKTLLSK